MIFASKNYIQFSYILLIYYFVFNIIHIVGRVAYTDRPPIIVRGSRNEENQARPTLQFFYFYFSGLPAEGKGRGPSLAVHQQLGMGHLIMSQGSRCGEECLIVLRHCQPYCSRVKKIFPGHRKNHNICVLILKFQYQSQPLRLLMRISPDPNLQREASCWLL